MDGFRIPLLLMSVAIYLIHGDAPKKPYANDFRWVFLYEDAERLSQFNKAILAEDLYFENVCYVQRRMLNRVNIYNNHQDLISAMRKQW